MRVRTEFPCQVGEIESLWIPLSDGVRLSARAWLPTGCEASPVGTVLEYIPYRKDDWTAHQDALRHRYFAGMGFASLRVDLRGTGDSEGVCLGEYLPQEQADALDALAWIAEQPWSNGRVGMIGYSWGGFNGLQVAACRPPQLHAVVTVDSTDDRYRDDCHYQGGCLLGSDMMKWAATMQAYLAQPPDPRIVGDRWREMWMERLESTPLLIAEWLSHQRRDAFWKQGSVAENYAAISAPVLAIGGWPDPYTNAVPRLLEHLECPRAGIIGPWEHAIPTPGVPGPQIDVLGTCAAWFDRWLHDADNGVDGWPMLRVYQQGWAAARPEPTVWPGRWLALDTWPPGGDSTLVLTLLDDGTLGEEPDTRHAGATVRLRGDAACGQSAGVWCPNGLDGELPDDQLNDDARSTCFDTRPLDHAIDVLGRPRLRLRLASDTPVALVAARFEDVAPDGSGSLLVSWGQLNLTRRDSDIDPTPLTHGRVYDVDLQLNTCGHRFEPGHVMRLALSPTYWPHAWPSPEAATLTLTLDGPSALELPLLPADARPCDLGELEVAEGLTSAEDDRSVRNRTIDAAGGVLRIVDRAHHRRTIPEVGTLTEQSSDTWLIAEDDPAAASVECSRALELVRQDLAWEIRVTGELASTRDAFFGTVTLSAEENGAEIHRSAREFMVARDLL